MTDWGGKWSKIESKRAERVRVRQSERGGERERPTKRERKRGESKPVSPDCGSTLYFRLPHN